MNAEAGAMRAGRPSGPPAERFSGHEDPPGEAPWAMQFVVHLEKSAPPTVSDVCSATAMATVRLLDEADANGWQPQVDRWLAGRIRKIVRRARGAAWARAEALPGITVEDATAKVRAYVPGPTDAVPVELSKLQVEGLALDHRDGDETRGAAERPVVVAMNPRWDLAEHPGKAAAQAAHAVQLAAATMEGATYVGWKARGFPVRIDWPDAVAWSQLEEKSPVVVTDAGYTVVEAGARTCVANWT